VREPHHLLLTRPCDRCIGEAGDTDSARQPTIESRFDEAGREESQRDRHADVALAATSSEKGRLLRSRRLHREYDSRR
jgi:hypothetical protein